ncbi:MAG: hypothetical protein CMO80_03560 [Verrucomicrobiales bacterium]|nr:hypothetical protein [Verrucomicrobiales bacterium]|tara:strand:- start:24 stop:395 length:372 start_codon:yes stop_codon:yes gene_type:complete
MKNELVIQLDPGRREFRPGETLSLIVGWQLDTQPESAEARLFWHTEGKGSGDIQIVETDVLHQPKMSEERKIGFQLPNAPYSYNGRLVSIKWAVELVVEPGSHSKLVEFSLSADGRALQPQIQ